MKHRDCSTRDSTYDVIHEGARLSRWTAPPGAVPSPGSAASTAAPPSRPETGPPPAFAHAFVDVAGCTAAPWGAIQ